MSLFTEEGTRQLIAKGPRRRVLVRQSVDPSLYRAYPRTLEPLTSAARLGAKAGRCIIIRPYPPALVCLRVATCERLVSRDAGITARARQSKDLRQRPDALHGTRCRISTLAPGTCQKDRQNLFPHRGAGYPYAADTPHGEGGLHIDPISAKGSLHPPVIACAVCARSRPLRFFTSASFFAGKKTNACPA